ncbi:MAG: PfkB family carbohydrate kinase, partial [Nitrosopumilaceae archaeon]|nr:PfkB family carbohydrate kinase [Nitrosopumilaceae archaeon]
GAGIQGDIRTFTVLGAYPLTTITAITSQNTSKFNQSQTVSKKTLEQQISSVLTDFKINGIKIGMVYDSTIIKTIQKHLQKTNVPIVLDPVIKSTTGGVLLKKSALSDFKKLLIPQSYIITPNKKEAEIISDTKISSKKSRLIAAKKIQQLGVKNVIITGIEDNGKVVDFVLEDNKHYEIAGKKLFIENHGSGCTYSAALLFSICSGNSIKLAAKFAKKTTLKSIKNSKELGKGIVITNIHEDDKIKSELSNAVKSFETIPKIHEKIPECQTNFVFSKTNPKTLNDILGILGRIVKTGNKVTSVGTLSYGASKHVATALLETNKKFPSIRSAVNIKYDKETISKLKKSGYKILSYDRKNEPKKIKKSGSSVKWGIRSAISRTKTKPDIIYHTGDFGKEPMILIFGESPTNIIKIISEL